MIWGAILISGIVTFTIRFLPLSPLMPRKLPQFVQDGMQYVSIAVLTPIVINAVLVGQNNTVLLDSNPKILATLVAFSVAIISKSILLTLVVGLLVIWVFELI